MMKFYKMLLVSLLLIILSIGSVSALDLNNEDIQNDLNDQNNLNNLNNQKDLTNLNFNNLNNQKDLTNLNFNNLNDYVDLNSDNQINQDNDAIQIKDNNKLASNLNADSDINLGTNSDINLNSDSNLTSSYSEDILNDCGIETKINQSISKLSSSNVLSNQLTEGNVHIVSQSNYSKYFDRNGNPLSGVISPYDTIDLTGKISSKNFVFTIPIHITSSSNAQLTNCMIKFENMTASGRSSVSNLYIRNSVEWCAGVYILNSTNVDVYGNDIYCTGANGNPVRVIYSNYSNIFGNRLETNFTGYMNLSWKRAGILLGDSHYNNIYSNNVTIKDSNPIYLTTYGFEKSNYNVIFNNTVNSSAISEDSGLSNPSAWAYGIHLMGDYNLALNNTIHNVYRGIDSEGSFNILAGNIIFNLTGGYFEGNDGTEGGDYGIHASYSNIVANNTIFDSKLTGSAIYLMPNNTAYGNIVYNISGKSGLEFNYYADNCNVYGNIIDVPLSNPIYVFGRMNNLTIENNVISSNNASGIVIKKQSNSKYPTNVTISNNFIMNYLRTFDSLPIDFTQVPSDANIIFYNNSIAVYNDTFFNYYDENGILKDCSLWNGLNNVFDVSIGSYNYNSLVYCGNFSNLPVDFVTVSSNITPLKSFIGSRISNNYREIGFNQYESLIEKLNGIYLEDTIFNNVYFKLNASNLSIDSLVFNFNDADKDGFSIGKGMKSGGINLENISFTNNRFYFKSSDLGDTLLFVNNVSRFVFDNNIVLVDSPNYALVLNSSNSSLRYNNITVNDYHSAILVSNQSVVVLDDNIIETLSGISIDCENASYPKSSVYVIDDNNYYNFFNDGGTFREDIEIEFNNTLKLGNLTNKRFIIDIPLKILSLGDNYSLINSFISFEGESSGSLLSNIHFMINDDLDSDSRLIDIVSIKDGVSNLQISNNSFSIDSIMDSSDDSSGIDYDEKVFSAIRLIGSDYLSQTIAIVNNSFDLSVDSNPVYGIYMSNKDDFHSSKVSPKEINILSNGFDIKSNDFAKAIYLDSLINVLIDGNNIHLSSLDENLNASVSELNLINNNSVYGLDLINNSTVYGLDLINLNSSTLSNNQINLDSRGMAYGVTLRDSINFRAFNNLIQTCGASSIGLGLYDSFDFNLTNNQIDSNGTLFFDSNGDFSDSLRDSFNKLVGDDDFGTSLSAILIRNNIKNNIIKNDYLYLDEFNGTLMDNNLSENNFNVSFVHSSNSTRDLQNLIDDTESDGVLYLGNLTFRDIGTLNVSKNISIDGGIFISLGDWDPLFKLIGDDSKGFSSFDSFNLKNGVYLLNNADVLVSAYAYNGTGLYSILVPKINISGNEFLDYDDSVVTESTNILKLVSDRSSLAPSNPIIIENNSLLSGIKPFKFELNSVFDGGDVFVNADSIPQRKSTKIIYEDMVTTAVQYLVDGRIGEYFNVVLKDEDGKILANKPIKIGFNGKVYNKTTDENGSAKLQINLAKYGTYTFAISFLGDDEYNASFEVAKITVKRQTPILKVSNVAYKASAKTKTITAILKTANNAPLKYKKLSFTINGKTYTASTNAKGVASLKVSLSSKRTYSFTVKLASDNTYNAVSKSAKLTIK